MQDLSFSLVTVFLLFFTGTHSKELQSNDSTSRCKPPDPHSGVPGMPGVPGIPGTPGSSGRDGFKGEKGSIGKRGLQGVIGIPGKIGPRGPEGYKGDIGEKGSAGIPGNTGLRGLKGPKGDKGSMGYKGENGIGTKGEKGDAANMDPRQRANWKQCVWKRFDGTDNGKIQECSFNKLHDNTALRVSYQGNFLVYSKNGCSRSYFKFNGNECSGPLPIESAVYTGGLYNIHRNHFFEGYCENLARGTVNVELWVGKCSGYSTPGDAHTGWNSVSRIMIEEVPPSQ